MRDHSRKTAFNVFAKADQRLGAWQLFADLQLRGVTIELLPEEKFSGESADIPTRKWLFFNPKAGLRYHFGSAISLYTSVAFSQREPTRNDILGDTNINPSTLSVIRDTDLPRHEEVLDWELGLRSRSRQLKADLNFFYMGFRNEITPIGIYLEQHYAQLRKNVARSYRIGVEGKATLQLGSRLRFSSLGYWMKGRIDRYEPENDPKKPVFKDVRIGGVPELQLQLQTDYRFPFLQDALSLWLRSRHQGKTYLNPIQENRFEAPSVFLLDTGLQLRLGVYAQLGLQLRNLLDERYYSSGEVDDGQPNYFGQAGLHAFASLRIDIR